MAGYVAPCGTGRMGQRLRRAHLAPALHLALYTDHATAIMAAQLPGRPAARADLAIERGTA